MQFLIADTFCDSLGRLTGDEQKQVKTTVFDLQLNPAQPGHQLHKLDRARDRNFWSVRVGRDVRLIVHRSSNRFLVCYVDHHDRAYAWAERRRLETHPQTGAAQLVEIRETVQEVVIPRYVEELAPAAVERPLLADWSDAEILALGVPADWLSELRGATREAVWSLVDRLPGEAAEALLEVATGGRGPGTPVAPVAPVAPAEASEPVVEPVAEAVVEVAPAPEIKPESAPVEAPVDPGELSEASFAHPDARRRFWLVEGQEELARALDHPWDKWMLFLHPVQRRWVDANFDGPARLSGTAGTGKSIVVLHRAVRLARENPEARVLVTTFSDALAGALAERLKRLSADRPRLVERIDVGSIGAVGKRLYQAQCGPWSTAPDELIAEALAEGAERSAAAVGGHRHSWQFLLDEWRQWVEPWQLTTWEAYRDAVRIGRKRRLSESQRAAAWTAFSCVWDRLRERALPTPAGALERLTARLLGAADRPYDFVLADESQDFGPAELRFLAALAGDGPNALFLVGDLGQRIFQTPFSWRAAGVDVGERSDGLRVNYRTSRQIVERAGRLVPDLLHDVDGNEEDRSRVVSAFGGVEPVVRGFDSIEQERAAVAAWLVEQAEAGVRPHETALIVRSDEQLERAVRATEAAGLPHVVLDGLEFDRTAPERVRVLTMPAAKGLEFRAVAVMACDDDVVPWQARIEQLGDVADLQEAYDTERHLLYVACTRARDALLISGVRPWSEFLEDLGHGRGPLRRS